MYWTSVSLSELLSNRRGPAISSGDLRRRAAVSPMWLRSLPHMPLIRHTSTHSLVSASRRFLDISNDFSTCNRYSSSNAALLDSLVDDQFICDRFWSTINGK
jgi:hypothetical protein